MPVLAELVPPTPKEDEERRKDAGINNVSSPPDSKEPHDLPEAAPNEKVDISSLNDEQFAYYVWNLDYTAEQYNFTQEQVDIMVRRVFELFENTAEGKYRQNHPDAKDDRERRIYIANELLEMFSFSAFKLFRVRQRQEFDRDNFSDQMIRSVTKMALNGEHPICCELLLERQLQSIHMFRLEVLFQSAAELNWYDRLEHNQEDRESAARIKEVIMRWMSYGANFYNNIYRDYAQKIGRRADFETKIKTIYLFEALHNMLAWEIYSYEASLANLQEAVSIIAESSDNYLIRALAENAVGIMSRTEGDDDLYEAEDDQNAMRYRENRAMKTALGSDYPDMQFIDLARGYTGLYDAGGNLQKVVIPRSGRVQDLGSLPLLGGEGKFQRAGNLKELSLMYGLPMRRIIERDFGIHLEDLDFSTQYYFLNYLKA